MTAFHPRLARPADLSALVRLSAEFCAAERHEFEEARTRAGFAPLLDDDRYCVVLVAEAVDGEIVGYAVVTWGWSIESGGRDALLDEIYSTEKRKGVGTRLVEYAVEECRRRGVPRVFLETEADNVDARRLYARIGFGVEDSVWMTLPIER
jgi:GNAT superfamily N-acetyltransferase